MILPEFISGAWYGDLRKLRHCAWISTYVCHCEAQQEPFNSFSPVYHTKVTQITRFLRMSLETIETHASRVAPVGVALIPLALWLLGGYVILRLVEASVNACKERYKPHTSFQGNIQLKCIAEM